MIDNFHLRLVFNNFYEFIDINNFYESSLRIALIDPINEKYYLNPYKEKIDVIISEPVYEIGSKEHIFNILKYNGNIHDVHFEILNENYSDYIDVRVNVVSLSALYWSNRIVLSKGIEGTVHVILSPDRVYYTK